jgi:hypothetical protein
MIDLKETKTLSEPISLVGESFWAGLVIESIHIRQMFA